MHVYKCSSIDSSSIEIYSPSKHNIDHTHRFFDIKKSRPKWNGSVNFQLRELNNLCRREMEVRFNFCVFI